MQYNGFTCNEVSGEGESKERGEARRRFESKCQWQFSVGVRVEK